MKTKGKKLIGLFFLFLVLINFPILSVIQTNGQVGSFPIKVVVIFLFWLCTIVLAALIVNR